MSIPLVLAPKTELNEQPSQEVRSQIRQHADVQRIYIAIDIKEQLELIEMETELSME
ncbi:toxic anion resistance protein, partial [Bacillus thuringiensis]|nr:toxic anion resistance protein [Bacillus thuringiensis]